MRQRITFITGATSGIGRACAIMFAKQGNDLIVTGRRADRLEALKLEIETTSRVKVVPLVCDIRNWNDLQASFQLLDEDWKQIEILINNAGLALNLNPIDEGVPEEWDQMIDTNIKGLLYTTRLIAPIMKDCRKGHIINIGSIAGREVYPNGNVYCATKHAVNALTQSMRIDLLPYGIKVTQISPGAVQTEFSQVRFKGDEIRAGKVYQGYKPLTPEDVASVVLFATNLPDHANINDLLLMPTAQATSSVFHKNII